MTAWHDQDEIDTTCWIEQQGNGTPPIDIYLVCKSASLDIEAPDSYRPIQTSTKKHAPGSEKALDLFLGGGRRYILRMSSELAEFRLAGTLAQNVSSPYDQRGYGSVHWPHSRS